MLTLDRWLKLLFATGSMGLYALAPLTGAGPLLLVVLLLPLMVYLVGGMLRRDTDDPRRILLGLRLEAGGGALYLIWLGGLVARAGLSLPLPLALALLGLVPTGVSWLALRRGAAPEEPGDA